MQEDVHKVLKRKGLLETTNAQALSARAQLDETAVAWLRTMSQRQT